MAWFKKAKKPKAVREDQRQRSSVPEGLWVKCDGCKEIIYNKELERNLRICPKCGHHFRIDATARLQLLLDEPRGARDVNGRGTWSRRSPRHSAGCRR